MIKITRTSRGARETEPDQAHLYEIAGQQMLFESQVASLSAFEQDQAEDLNSEFKREEWSGGELAPEMLDKSNAVLRYQAMAQFDRTDRRVHFWRKDEHAQIDIDDQPVCHIDYADNHIHLLEQSSFDNRLNLEVVTGPALVTLLAQKEVYCLHAGAISTPAGNVALIGESGAGKSTLSGHVDHTWSQISDDVLPLRLINDGQVVELEANFPQLKLDGAQVVTPANDGATLQYVLRINPEQSKQIEFSLLSRTDAMLQIVRHTVAARLFDKQVMRAHAKFAKRMSAVIPVIELSYPRELAKLDDLRIAIVEYLTELQGS